MLPAETALCLLGALQGLLVGRRRRGHQLVLVPAMDLVVVHRLATGGVGLVSQLGRRFLGAPSVPAGKFNELVRRIVAAHPDRAIGAGSGEP